MTNADLQTIGILLQGAAAATLAFFAWKGLSAWKDQSRAKHRIDVLRRLSRGAFRVASAAHDARGNIRRAMRPADVVDWTDEQKQQTSRILRAAAERIQRTSDSLLQTLLEARGTWGKDEDLLKEGNSLARQVQHIHGSFGQLILMLAAENPGDISQEPQNRMATIHVCLGSWTPNGDQEVAALMNSFNSFHRQIEIKFESVYK